MMKQRWSDSEAPTGLLNISIDDISYNAADDVKQNILKACNECSYSGRIENREFATLLYADTGIPVTGCHLLRGTEDKVDISPWFDILQSAEPLSLVIIHNHTIEAPFSFDDIKTFFSYKSLTLVILTVGTYAYYLEKSVESVCNYDTFIEELKNSFPGKAYFKSDGKWDITKLDGFLENVFREFKIIHGRWS